MSHALRPIPPSRPAPARSATLPRLTPLDAAVLGLLALAIASHILAATLALGWWTAALTDLLEAAYIALLARRASWRPLVIRLAIFGLAAGLVELATDAAGEQFAHSLIYPPAEPMLWASPIYMPLAWAVTLFPLAYLAWRLRSLTPPLPLWLSILICACAGALNVPFYEEMAYHARWWRYASAPHLGHTPIYVIFFEGAIAALLPLLVTHFTRFTHHAPRAAVPLGVALGLWMPIAAFITWSLLGH